MTMSFADPAGISPLFIVTLLLVASLPGGSRNRMSGYTKEAKAVEPSKNNNVRKKLRLFKAPPCT